RATRRRGSSRIPTSATASSRPWSMAHCHRRSRLWGRYAFDHHCPRRVLLGIGELPIDDVEAGECDECALPAGVRAIEHYSVMDFPGRRRCRCDVPAPSNSVSEGAAGRVRPALWESAGRPLLKVVELCFANNLCAGLRGGGTAVVSAPARTTRSGGSVLHECVGAYTTSGRVPGRRECE